MLGGTPFGAQVSLEANGIAITLPTGTSRDVIAEVARILVEGGISLYRLQEVQASLESWSPAGDEQAGGGVTTVPTPTALAAADAIADSNEPVDHRGSPIPTFGMIASRFKELRKRRGR